MLRKTEMHISMAQRNKEEQTKAREKIELEDSKNETVYDNKIKMYH